MPGFGNRIARVSKKGPGKVWHTARPWARLGGERSARITSLETPTPLVAESSWATRSAPNHIKMDRVGGFRCNKADVKSEFFTGAPTAAGEAGKSLFCEVSHEDWRLIEHFDGCLAMKIRAVLVKVKS